MARALAAFGDIALWLRSISPIWKPMVYTGFSAVIGSWKITETSRPRIDRRSRAIGADQLPAAELDRSLDVAVLRQQAEQRHGGGRLAGSGLADDGQHLAAIEVEVGTDDGRVPGAVDPEVDIQVADREHRSVDDCRHG